MDLSIELNLIIDEVHKMNAGNLTRNEINELKIRVKNLKMQILLIKLRRKLCDLNCEIATAIMDYYIQKNKKKSEKIRQNGI
jgi:hypothetical protein